MPSAARLGDLIGHAPPIPPDARGRGGPGGVPTGLIIGPCSGNVFVNGIPAARSGVDLAVCSLHPPVPLQIASGSSNVFINGCPAARLGDLIKCSAIIITGSGNVFIGGGGSGASGTVQTDVLIPELETEPVILQSLEGSDAGADSLDESVPPMSYGEQMSKVGGFYGDLAIGAAKGILNLIPETLAFAYRMSGYAIAGVASHFDTDISEAMFAKYEKVTGRLWQYENSIQEFGGVAAQLASPLIARGATTVGAVIYNAEIGALRVAATEVSVIQSRQVEAINLSSSSAMNSARANALFNMEARQTRAASDGFVKAVSERRNLFVAKPGTDDFKFLQMTGADASAGGPGNLSILVRGDNPQRLTLMEEFLHGTQSKRWGDPVMDVTGADTAFREWHVRDFMSRHSGMLGWDASEKAVLKTELDYWAAKAGKGGKR